MTIRRPIRALRPAIGLLLLAGVALSWHLDWWSSRRDWRQATGWTEIPAAELPASEPRGSELDPDSGQPRIEWLGHSGFVIRWLGRTVVIDPNVNDWCTLSSRVLKVPSDLAAIGPVDAVLVSHPHFDHLDLPTLRRIGEVNGGLGSLIVPSGSEGYVDRPDLSAEAIVPLRAGDSVRVGPLEVIAVAAAHNGSRLHPFASERLALGYILRSAQFTLYYSGDTGGSAPFAAIRDAYHPQMAILPIGAYLPRFPMKYYHLSPEEAVAAAAVLEVETVIPCHFGTYVLSLDRPSWALPRFARAAKARGVSWRMPRLLDYGAMAASARTRTKGPA